jgi:hypothetical protein
MTRISYKGIAPGAYQAMLGLEFHSPEAGSHVSIAAADDRLKREDR